MRQAGTLSNRDHAQRLADYLLTQSIDARVDPDGDSWALWVRDEDHLSQAREILADFRADPDAPKYRAAGGAGALRKQQQRTDAQRQRNFISLRDRWDARRGGRQPLTVALIAACAVIFLFSGIDAQQRGKVNQYLWFGALPTQVDQWDTWNGTTAIEHGQVWRLITPIFIHGHIFHLVFNMYWLYLFGSLIEERRGTIRFALFVLIIAATSNWAQYDFSVRSGVLPLEAMLFGGMSGVNYGLFGYIWTKSRFEPQLGLYVPPSTTFILMLWLVVCWTGKVGPVANWAHTVGLGAGAVIAYIPVAWRRLNR